jgi:aminopeptidase-like protein
LFVPETLRQLIDDPAANPVIQALSRIDSAILLHSLPTLLESFYEFINRNRTGLFSNPQQATLTITDYIRASTADFYDSCDGLIYVSQVNLSDVWNARLQLLSVIEEKNVFSNAQPKLQPILSERCRLTVDEFRSR